jgi:molybdate transport system substrate-binding protein
MGVLSDPELKTVAIANPEHAPYGRAAKAAITSLGLADRLQGKIVGAENIAQAAQFVDSGNAEVGFISLTSALTERLRADGTYVEVPASAYPPIVQGAVVVKGSAHVGLAREFLAFLLSPAVQRQLAGMGLKAPGAAR